jgi:hypothetical protein
MPDDASKDEHPNPDLQNAETGTQNGVPHGVTTEESKGLPDSGRHETESAPLHQTEK